MLARLDGQPRGIEADFGRLAEDDRIKCRFRGQHCSQIMMVAQSVGGRIAAGDGDKIGPISLRNRGHMLVAGDLTKTDKAEL